MILKLANVNPKSVLAEKGLNALEHNLPEALALSLRGARELPLKFRDQLSGWFSSPEEVPTEQIPASSPGEGGVVPSNENKTPDEELTSELKRLAPSAQKSKEEMLRRYQPKPGNANSGMSSGDFFLDEDYMPLGPSVHITPPYFNL